MEIHYIELCGKFTIPYCKEKYKTLKQKHGIESGIRRRFQAALLLLLALFLIPPAAGAVSFSYPSSVPLSFITRV